MKLLWNHDDSVEFSLKRVSDHDTTLPIVQPWIVILHEIDEGCYQVSQTFD